MIYKPGMVIFKTFQEAHDAGWGLSTEKTLFHGYVTRKNFDVFSAPVFIAGGSRKGQLYVEVPNYNSKNYSFRRYLVTIDGWKDYTLWIQNNKEG